MKNELTVKVFHGPALEPYIRDLADLRITVFREFPYLYDGSFDYEEKYLKTYLRSQKSIVVLVFDGKKVVGASTGIPMAEESDEFKRPFINYGIDPATVFYCGESILRKEYRGSGVYRTFFDEREKQAQKLGLEYSAFCAVRRSENHPLRPDNYSPLDPIWEKYGYEKKPELQTTYRWKDVDEENETNKTMIFWLKNLARKHV